MALTPYKSVVLPDSVLDYSRPGVRISSAGKAWFVDREFVVPVLYRTPRITGTGMVRVGLMNLRNLRLRMYDYYIRLPEDVAIEFTLAWL